MKRIKKALALLLVGMMIPAMLMGCKPKVKPDETAKILFNLTIKGDKSDLSKLGANQSDMDKLVKTQKETFTKQFKSTFESAGLKVKDDQIEEVYKSYMDALKKVSVTTEVVSQKEKEAQVKVKSTYIEGTKISEKAGTDAVEQFKDTKITNQEELATKVTDAFIKNLVAGLKEAKPSTDKKEKTFKFVLKDKVWIPENSLNYGIGIGELAAQ